MASAKRQAIEVFERLAFAAELLGDRRARSYGAAGWALRGVSRDLRDAFDEGELANLKGIGAASLSIIAEILSGRRPERLERYEAELPAGLFEMRRVKGLGPKKIRRLYEGLSISTLAELEYACVENRLVELDGFGEKTQARVLEQLRRLRAQEGLMRRDTAVAVIQPVLDALRALETVKGVYIVGELARGLELIASLALLVWTDDAEETRARFDALRPAGPTLDLFTVSEEGALGAARVWHSSSVEHRAKLAAQARARGIELGERRWNGPPCPDEPAVYRALGLVPTAPERREAEVPLVEQGRSVPRLVRREDLRGALHNHTDASDGSASLVTMRAAAVAQGLTYLGVSDHSVSASYAGGLDATRLEAQRGEIASLNREPSGCLLLSGVESDILGDGRLDYPAEVLEHLDVVVASVHQPYGQGRATMTARMVAAASHPRVDVIGHPTGRLLLGRDPYDFDLATFLDACASSGCAVELNANPARLDLCEVHLRMAKERGVLVSIAADAHAPDELAHLEHGIAIARRAGLTADDVLNTRSAQELCAWRDARRLA